jgi:hypothetical protein
MYLQSAQWGFDELLRMQLLNPAFLFYLIGILASLRAVQHALRNHDSTLSEEHKRVVEKWWQTTPLSTPELHFIRTSRDLILKRGSFKSYAIVTESSTGEEPNPEITNVSYELAYYDKAGERHDLEKEIRRAIDWCDRELTESKRSCHPAHPETALGKPQIRASGTTTMCLPTVVVVSGIIKSMPRRRGCGR